MGGDLTPPWPAMNTAERAQAYSPSSVLGGNIEPFIEAYTEQSTAAYAALPTFQTLAYGPQPAQTIDVVMPKSAKAVPCHVFIHGGYWQQLSKTDSFFAAPETVAQGMAFAAVGYTLAPHASLDDIVAEIVSALRHLHRNAASLGLDPQRIVVSGSSAGAHLAAMAALILQGDEKPAGLILLSGIYDLRPLIGTYINDAVGLDDASAKRNSPLMQDIASFPPCVIAWGEIETDEFKRQSRHFAHGLGFAGRNVVTLEMAGRNHFDIVHDLTGDTAIGRHLTRLAKR